MKLTIHLVDGSVHVVNDVTDAQVDDIRAAALTEGKWFSFVDDADDVDPVTVTIPGRSVLLFTTER